MFTLVQKKKQNTQSIEGNIHKSQDIFGKYQSDCLKGIAIIMLIAHHCFLGPSRYKGQELIFIIPESVWNYVALFFKICVSLFVFISAYGLTKKMMSLPKDADSQTTHKFIGNMILSRVIRLLGGFIFVFLLVDIFALFYDPGRLAEIYGSVFPLNMEYYILDMLGLAQPGDTYISRNLLVLQPGTDTDRTCSPVLSAFREGGVFSVFVCGCSTELYSYFRKHKYLALYLVHCCRYCCGLW